MRTLAASAGEPSSARIGEEHSRFSQRAGTLREGRLARTKRHVSSRVHAGGACQRVVFTGSGAAVAQGAGLKLASLGSRRNEVLV